MDSMSITNTVLIVSGLFAAIIGIAAFFNPNLARWINAPGTPILKAIISTLIGIAIMLIGVLIPFPG